MALTADGFDHGSDGEVFDGAQVAQGDFADEVDGLGGEGVVGEPAAVEVVVDEVAGALGTQRFEVGGLGTEQSEIDRSEATCPEGVRSSESIKCGF